MQQSDYGNQLKEPRIWKASVAMLFLAGILFLLLFRGAVSAYALPPGFQEYFVLGNENHLYRMIVGTGVSIPPLDGNQRYMASIVDITITIDNQVVFYDHWEDGYEADILNPAQTGSITGTLVFGDGDPTNGDAADYTGRAGDILLAGDTLPLSSRNNIIAASAITGYVPINPRQNAAIRFDGGDRIVATAGPIGLVHNMWPINLNASTPDQSWIGDSWEIYSVQTLENATSYRTPVGVDMGVNNAQFENVDLQIQALTDTTFIQIDNGVITVSFNLNRGQTYSSQGFIDDLDVTATTQISITAGAQIQSDKAIQVGLVAYQYQSGVGFQDRYFNMIPERIWGKDYVMPLADNGADSEIYIYNANPFTITIQAVDTAHNSVFNLGPASTIDYTTATGNGIPTLSGVRLSSEDTFWAIATASSNLVDYDWGHTFIPQIYLADEYYASWAPGNVLLPPKQAACGSNGNVPGSQLCRNGSPLWVTAVEDDTTIFVDYDNDEIVDESFVLNALEIKVLRDEIDFNQSGAHVWTQGKEKIALIWGEDPSVAGTSTPNLDMGHLVLPLSQNWLTPALTFEKKSIPNAIPPEGGTVTFHLQTATSSFASVENIVITDTLPFSWTYLSNSALISYPTGTTATVEPIISAGNNQQTLFWDLDATLAQSQTLALQFQAAISTANGIGTRRFDGFESASYGGGSGGWASNWLDSQGDGPFSGDIQIVDEANVRPYSGDRQLQVTDNNYAIERQLDLSAFNYPVLRFKRLFRSLENNEIFGVAVYDGFSYTSVLTWTASVSQNLWLQEEVDLRTFISNAARIRFRGISDVEPSDYLHLDDIEIYDRLAVNTNNAQLKGTYAGFDISASDHSNVYISPLKLLKIANSDFAPLGSSIVYTLTYQNIGANSEIDNVVIWDTLDPSLNFVSASNGGQYLSATHTISWSVGTILTDAVGSLVFTATLNADHLPNDGDIIENRAYLSNDKIELHSNLTAVTVQAPELEFNKQAPAIAYPGQIITYTIFYQNSGSLAATNTILTDAIPAGVDYVANSCNGCAVISASNQLAWNLNSPPPGASGVLTFAVQVSNTVPSGGIISNTAQYNHNFLNSPRNTNIAGTVISPVTLGKTSSYTEVQPGQALTFTIQYSNTTSAFTPTSIIIDDEIPQYSTYLGGSASGEAGVITVSYSIDGGNNYQPTEPGNPAAVTHLRWAQSALQAQATKTVGFQVKAAQVYTLPGIINIINQATLKTAEIQPLLSNAVVIPVILPSTTLTISKYAADINGPPLYISDTIRYTLRLTNTGSYTAVNISLNDDLPEQVTYQTSAAQQGNIIENNGVITWNIAALPPDGITATLFITVTINPATEGQSITNTASLSATNFPDSPIVAPPVCPNGEPANPDGTCNSVPQLPETPTATLILSKYAADINGPPLLEGDTIRYTLKLTNTSAYTALNVTVIDDLPQQVSFENAASDQGTASEENGRVTWEIPALSPQNPAARLFITTTVKPETAGEYITNTAFVTGENVTVPPEPPPPVCPDGDPVNPDGSCNSTPIPTTTLAIAKSSYDINGPPLIEGDMLQYALQITNTGSYTALEITLVDKLPPQLIFENATADRGLIVEQFGLITWTIAALPPNASRATLLISSTINLDTAGESISNTAFVVADNVPYPPDPPPPVCPDGEPLNAEGLCDTTPIESTGPVICPLDSYESDDAPAQSQVIDLINSHIISQVHAFHLPGDQDWLQFQVHPGAAYTFATSNLARMADTQLTLYAPDGITVLARNDDGATNSQASRITWTAPLTPLNYAVYLAAAQTPYNAHSCNTGYTLSLTQTIGGKFDNNETMITARGASGSLNLGGPLTYTISLYNADVYWAAPVTVTNQFPVSVTLQSVAICEREIRSNAFYQYSLTMTGNGFRWVGAVGSGAGVNLCAVGSIATQPWTTTNTVWINWNEQSITRSVTGAIIPLLPPPGYEIYLPLVLK